MSWIVDSITAVFFVVIFKLSKLQVFVFRNCGFYVWIQNVRGVFLVVQSHHNAILFITIVIITV
jgi:hypothetical protein